ncbi:MAG: hypothetical protein HY293_14015 [Planctomycetes bacterium]|nr:hypothetical protein [Planctomycetota bacterium]
MSDRRAPVKTAALFVPLIVAVLALHAWGDAMAGGLGRAIGAWQYPERSHPPFLIRVPRRSPDADDFTARELEKFVAQALQAHCEELGLRAPAPPVKIVLLDLDTDVRRFGWSAAELLVNVNESLFDPATRTIYVRMERKLDQIAVPAALRVAAARLLLHDAGSARWSPWLTEGLVGRLEGGKPGALRGWPADTTLKDLLTAREADFQGIHRASYARTARLFVAFLADAKPEKFAYYYRESRAGSPPSPEPLFELEAEWVRWIQDLK